MQRTTLAVIVVAVVALLATGGVATADDVAAQDDTVTVELSVTTPDGDAVGGADATIEWDGGSVETTTRSNGRVLEDVPSDTPLEVTLEHDDYVQNVPYRVSGVESNDVVEMTMYPPATMDVEVRNDDGPVENAVVRLRKHGQSRLADRGETDEDGVYSSPDIETGTYDLRVEKAGYYEEQMDVDVSDETEQTVQVERGRVTVDLRTQDPTPEGPGAVSASVSFERNGNHVKTVTTSDADTTGVTLDVNTRYDVTAEREGYSTATNRLATGEEDGEYVINVTRTPGISLEAGSDRLVVGEDLRVEVSDEYDRPVEGASVFVNDEERAETDADGVAHVAIEEEGNASVRAEWDGHESETVTVRGISEAEAEDGDGEASDGSPGFGAAAALVAMVVGIALLVRRS